jgi:two-component sensor histidine kinase
MPARVFNKGIRPQGIRTFLILFALALAIPLLILAAFAFDRMAALEQAETERRVMQVAQNLASDIDRDLDRATTTLETLATSAALRRGDLQSFHAQAVLALRRTKAAIILIDSTYQQLVDTLKDYGAPLPPTADPQTAKRVFDTKERQVSNLFRGSISGRPVFNVEVPVIHDGVVRYVLIMSFQAAYITDLLRAAQIDPPWITGVSDNEGIIVARSQRHEEFVGKPLPRDLLKQSRIAKDVFRATSVTGEQVLRATVRSQIAGWLVSATVPLAYLEAPRKRGLAFATTMGVAALMLGATLAYVFGGFMARPLDAATQAAAAVGRGAQVEPIRSPLKEANALTQTLSEASLELKRRSEQSEFLMGELAHRAKNQLAVIKGMALQTAKQTTSVEHFVEQFGQRIQGLAESQDLMVRQSWQGAWLRDLVRAHLNLFAAGDRATLDGHDLFLNSTAVQNIGFALHELATNASKHGALSSPQGQVSVSWNHDGDRFHLSWRESNGAPVQSPQHRGFGSLVLADLVAQALQGTSVLEFSAGGLLWRLDIPASFALGASPST